ncbi:MAG: hypothetical protein WAU12_13880 [Saprospiraceae bacterium]
MTNKFKISEFESYFSATMLEEGFDLSQKRSDWDIDENKGVTKATYNVIGLKPIHVTLNKTKHLVLNFHCDCTHFKTNKGCKHITGLLYIGQIKTVRLKPVNEQRKVGFEELFDVLNADELGGFLKFYASNNLAFNKLFKQYFSYKFIQYGLSFNDYFNQIIQSHMDVRGKYSIKSKKLICQIFELHLFRTDHLLRNNDWSGALDIIEVIINRIYQLDFKEPAKNIEFIVEKSHNNLMAIASQTIAPLLRRKITKISIELISLRNYNYFKHDNAVELARINLEQNFEIVKNLLEEKISVSDGEEKAQWLFQLYSFLTSTKNFNLVEFYSDYIDNEDNITGFLEIIERNNFQDANVDRILEIKILKMTGDESSELILKLAAYLISASKDQLYGMLFEHIYKDTMDENELNSKILISIAADNPKIAKQISLSKYFKKDKGEQVQLFSKILFNAGKLKELMSYLQKYGDLEAVMPIMVALFQNNAETALDLLKEKLGQYLDAHVGGQSNQMLEDIIKDLSKAMLNDEIEEIMEYVLSNYGNRKSLIKSLRSFSYL